MAKSYIRFLGDGIKEDDEILGARGAELARWASLGIPIPPGFIIIREAHGEYRRKAEAFLRQLLAEIAENLGKIANTMQGDTKPPLLLFIRSGATNPPFKLGINDTTTEELVTQAGEAAAYENCKEFLQMFGYFVMGLEYSEVEKILRAMKLEVGIRGRVDIIPKYRRIIEETAGKTFPESIEEQLWMAIGRIFGTQDEGEVAIIVQRAVLGNLSDDSGSGICFSRDPFTGQRELYGAYQKRARGEVHPISLSQGRSRTPLQEEMPSIYSELETFAKELESFYKDMQEIEFTIERGKLWILKAARGERNTKAALKVALDMEREGEITSTDVIKRITPAQLEQLLHPHIDPESIQELEEISGTGTLASPGACVGKVFFDVDDLRAHLAQAEKDKVILVKDEIDPEDVTSLDLVEGILTTTGGTTSHAAVIARAKGITCIVGYEGIKIDTEQKCLVAGERTVKQGEIISMEVGEKLAVYIGEAKLVKGSLLELFDDIRAFIELVEKVSQKMGVRMGVRANADTPADAKLARDFGAEGLGLCRTEHMFFKDERLDTVRRVFLAPTAQEREESLEALLQLQKADFKELYEVMAGLPVTIRLLDIPVHEFFPQTREEMEELIEQMGYADNADVRRRIQSLRETNPMMGRRGCRFGITFPDVYEAQTRAIFMAAYEAMREGCEAHPQVMIPMVMNVEELKILKEMIKRVEKKVRKDYGVSEDEKLEYPIGTMIELPSAALTANTLAEVAEFFSFGTNDLTQATYGLSRDDARTFLPYYVEHQILQGNPFQILGDEVKELIKVAVKRGRAARRDIGIGLCGEHGGEPSGARFCMEMDLDYVSCSPYRIPLAKLATVQAAIEKMESE